jgi:hypothetical protein
MVFLRIKNYYKHLGTGGSCLLWLLGRQRSGGSMVGNQPWKIVRPTLSQKYSTHERAGEVAQVVESLPTKCEAQSSNFSTTNKGIHAKYRKYEQYKNYESNDSVPNLLLIFLRLQRSRYVGSTTLQI